MPLTIIPALIYGVVLGLYEVFIIHRDIAILEGRLGHTIHAIILSMFFVFCTINAEFIINLISFLREISFAPLALQTIIGLIATIKIHIVTRMRTTNYSAGETWIHSIIVGGLVFSAPYAYFLIKPILPRWLI